MGCCGSEVWSPLHHVLGTPVSHCDGDTKRADHRGRCILLCKSCLFLEEALHRVRGYHAKCAPEISQVQELDGFPMFDKDPSDAAFTWYFLPLGHSVNLAASYDLILGGYGDDLLSRGTLNPLNGWAKDRTKPLTKEQVLARRDVELRRVDDPSLPLDELGFVARRASTSYARGPQWELTEWIRN